MAFDGEAVTGRGPTLPYPGIDFPIPDGARSVVIDFECAGGGQFSVELGDAMVLGQAPLSGICDGTHELAWPVTVQTGPTLMVMVPEDVDWTALPHFSVAEFDKDTAIAEECEAFTDIYSALVNADTGYTQYSAFDAAEWTTRVNRAVTDLEAIAEGSQSVLAETFAQLQTIISDPGRTVGAVRTGTDDLVNEIRQVCTTNQTPFVINAEFGG